MTELNIEEDPSLFIIEPDTLTFKLDTDNLIGLSSNKSQIAKKIEIKIKNQVNEYLSFGIKTIKKLKLNYIITPSYCIILPKEEKLIKVRFKRDESEELKLKSSKIGLEGFVISKEEKNLNAKVLFDKYKKSGEKIVRKIIQVRSQFLDKYDKTISSLSNLNSDIQDNEKLIFVSALSKDLNIGNSDKSNKQIKDKEEKNPLLNFFY